MAARNEEHHQPAAQLIVHMYIPDERRVILRGDARSLCRQGTYTHCRKTPAFCMRREESGNPVMR